MPVSSAALVNSWSSISKVICILNCSGSKTMSQIMPQQVRNVAFKVGRLLGRNRQGYEL
jgi:hypothetical protein